MTSKTFKLEDYEVQELTDAFQVFDVAKRGLIPFEQAKIIGAGKFVTLISPNQAFHSANLRLCGESP